MTEKYVKRYRTCCQKRLIERTNEVVMVRKKSFTHKCNILHPINLNIWKWKTKKKKKFHQTVKLIIHNCLSSVLSIEMISIINTKNKKLYTKQNKFNIIIFSINFFTISVFTHKKFLSKSLLQSSKNNEKSIEIT